jgi:hypothetical protein
VLSKLKDWLTGALVVLFILMLQPGLLSTSILPALILVLLVALIGISFHTHQQAWGWIYVTLAILLILLWLIPGDQLSLPDLSF